MFITFAKLELCQTLCIVSEVINRISFVVYVLFELLGIGIRENEEQLKGKPVCDFACDLSFSQ